MSGGARVATSGSTAGGRENLLTGCQRRWGKIGGDILS